MKRLSPVLIIAAVAAIAAALLRNNSTEELSPETWKPVEPS